MKPNLQSHHGAGYIYHFCIKKKYFFTTKLPKWVFCCLFFFFYWKLFEFWKNWHLRRSKFDVCSLLLFICVLFVTHLDHFYRSSGEIQMTVTVQWTLLEFLAHHFLCLGLFQSQYLCWHLWEDSAEENPEGSVEDRPEQPGEDHCVTTKQWQPGKLRNKDHIHKDQLVMNLTL